MKTVCLLAALLAVVPNTLAQTRAENLATSDTLREALERAGFDDGIQAANGSDLDRKLTSSGFGSSPDTFVAGYFFEDELEDGSLGPLHVSLFDRSRRIWVQRPNVKADLKKLGLDGGGPVMSITITPKLVLLDTHATPSAGFAVVLDRSLKVITSLGGFGAEVTNEGSIWYLGNMVHFADTHQETLKIFDMGRRSDVEIFPGTKLSPVAERYRRRIEAAYAAVHETHRVDDFDRGIESIAERNSTTFGFVVVYGSYYLQDAGVTHPELTTIARCDRGSTGIWLCSEREIVQFAREAGLLISLDSDGHYDTRTFEKLVQAGLDRKP